MTTVVFSHRSWLCSYCISGVASMHPWGSWQPYPRFRAVEALPKLGSDALHSKASREARLMDRNVCLISDASNSGSGGKGSTRVQRPDPPTDNQGARAFIGWGRGLHAETAQSAPTIILKLVIRCLTKHHFNCFKHSSSLVPGSDRLHFLEASPWNCVRLYVTATVWSSGS